MDGYLTAQEAARRIGFTERYLRELLNKGKIPGAFKEGRRWRIPESAARRDRQRARLTDAIRSAVEERLKAGQPPEEIATEVRISVRSVYTINGELAKRKRAEPVQIESNKTPRGEEIVKRYADGYTEREWHGYEDR